MRQPAHEHNIHCLRGTRLLGQSQTVQRVHLGSGGLHLLHQILGVLGGSGNNRHGVDLLGGGDDLSVGLEILQPTGSLQQLEGDNKVRLAFINNRRIHLVAVAHISDHAAAALGHTVDLGHLDVISLLHEQVAQQLTGQQGALATHAYDHNILGFHCLNPPCRCSQRPPRGTAARTRRSPHTGCCPPRPCPP